MNICSIICIYTQRLQVYILRIGVLYIMYIYYILHILHV